MAEDTRDELLGRLVGVPLDRFVEQRNRLARELRAGGDRDTAAWLAGLRRPAPGIWALDQLARGDRDRVAALLDLSAELRAAQSRAMRGDRDAAGEMRDLGARLQRAVDDAVRRAAALLRDAGHGVTTDTMLGMAATVRAALAAGEATRRQLADGLLLAPVEEGSGFGFEMPGGPDLRVIEGGAGRATAEAKPGGPHPQREHSEAAERARELRRRADEAARTADDAEAAAAQRRAEADTLHGRAAGVRARLRALEDELHEAEVAARDADIAAREALTAARTARRDADAAETEAQDAATDAATTD